MPTKAKKSKGNVEWNQSNYIMFGVDDSDDDEFTEEPVDQSIQLDFSSDPLEVANQLRKVADWLERHKDEKINADID